MNYLYSLNICTASTMMLHCHLIRSPHRASARWTATSLQAFRNACAKGANASSTGVGRADCSDAGPLSALDFASAAAVG